MNLKLIGIYLITIGSFCRADSASDDYKNRDFESAALRFQIQAEAGDPRSQNNLGALYLRGKGVPQNYQKAYELFLQSATENFKGAIFNLGVMNLRGYGRKKNYQEAALWFRKGAELNDPEAQFFLGVLLSKGLGIQSDLASAAKWFQKSEPEASIATFTMYRRLKRRLRRL